MSTPVTELNLLLRRLRANVETGAKMRAELAAKIAESDIAALYAIRWLQQKPKELHLASYSAFVLAEMGKAATQESGLAVCVTEMRDWLARWSPEYSTSQFSNLVHADEYEAVKELLRYLEGAQRYLATEVSK
jgi:hypothetical protein